MIGVAAAMAALSILSRAGAAASVAAAAARRCSALPPLLPLLVVIAISSRAALWNLSCQTAPVRRSRGGHMLVRHAAIDMGW